MANQDKERGEFEAWATAQRFINVKFGETGVLPTVAAIEMAWQASASRYTARIADLEADVARMKARLIDKGLTPADKAQNFANNLSRSAARLDWLELHAKLDWTMLYDGIRITFDAPKGIENLSSISSAIDEAMKGGA